MSDVSMHWRPDLAWRGCREQLGVGSGMPREVLWRTELVCAIETATTDQKQTAKQARSVR